MDPEQVLAEGGEALIAGWLNATLTAGLRLPEDESEERREFLLAGANAALRELAPAGAWLGERIQAIPSLDEGKALQVLIPSGGVHLLQGRIAQFQGFQFRLARGQIRRQRMVRKLRMVGMTPAGPGKEGISLFHAVDRV